MATGPTETSTAPTTSQQVGGAIVQSVFTGLAQVIVSRTGGSGKTKQQQPSLSLEVKASPRQLVALAAAGIPVIRGSFIHPSAVQDRAFQTKLFTALAEAGEPIPQRISAGEFFVKGVVFPSIPGAQKLPARTRPALMAAVRARTRPRNIRPGPIGPGLAERLRIYHGLL